MGAMFAIPLHNAISRQHASSKNFHGDATFQPNRLIPKTFPTPRMGDEVDHNWMTVGLVRLFEPELPASETRPRITVSCSLRL
jgi:hypothetical protein